MKVTVDIKADSKFPVDRKAIRQRIRDVLISKDIDRDVYVSVSVVGDRKMKWINNHYRKKPSTTDVLSFPTEDPTQPMDNHGFFHPEDAGLILGDIIVSYPQAVIQASEKNKMLDEVVCDLVEHGMLHLLGYHHD